VTTDDALFEQVAARIQASMLWLSGAGALAGWLLLGWAWGLGFLAGGLASWGNFYWLHQLTASLGSAFAGPRKRMVLYFCLRYLLLGAGGVFLVKVVGVNLTAGLLGLLVMPASVILEILYELIYAR
jgi:hypothetical protein